MKWRKAKRKISELKPSKRPFCPWKGDEATAMFHKSHADGHRIVYFKCQQCTLEYQIRTWRDGEDVEKHFHFCPECGAKDQSDCQWIADELGAIFQQIGPQHEVK